MNEREETFEEVLGYMTAHESGDAEEAFFDRAAWRELIVRLRAAHQREVATKDSEIARLKAKRCEYALLNHGCTAEDRHFHRTIELEREIARLKAALKPVLECLHYDVGNSFKAEISYDELSDEVIGEFFDKDGAIVITESEVNGILNAVREAQRIAKEGGVA